MIEAKTEQGLSAQRIYQDLVEQNGFKGSYESVKRFIRKLKNAQPQRVWRLEAQPGEEVQVDFGLTDLIVIRTASKLERSSACLQKRKRSAAIKLAIVDGPPDIASQFGDRPNLGAPESHFLTR